METVLVEQFRVPKAELGTSLSQFYRAPFVEFDAKIIPPPDLMKDLKLEFLKRNLWLPIRREDNAIVVLIDNPQDLQRVDAIHQLLRGQNVVLAVGPAQGHQHVPGAGRRRAARPRTTSATS